MATTDKVTEIHYDDIRILIKVTDFGQLNQYFV